MWKNNPSGFRRGSTAAFVHQFEERSGLASMKIMRLFLTATLAALALCSLPSDVLALDVSADSRTYVIFRETADEKSIAPLYEYLDLNAEGIAGKDVSLYVSGWLRADLGEEWAEDDFETSLSYAYLDLGLRPGTKLSLGRLYVFEGVASEQVDGLYAKADLSQWFGVAAFGGTPVEEESGDIQSDTLYGGRVYHQWPGLYSIGLSYLKQSGDSADAREEQGIDVWVRPVSMVDLQGQSAYNAESSGWMSHSYNVAVSPVNSLRLIAAYAMTDYEHYFAAPTLSAFSPTVIDPREEVTEAGGIVDYTLSPSLGASLEYKNYHYELKGGADYYGGELRYSRTGYAAGLSAHRMDGGEKDLKYSRYRAYASKRLGKAGMVLDLLNVDYDEEILGTSNAFTALAALDYEVAERATAGIDLEYSENPNFDSEFKVLLKFLYRFSKGA